MTKSVKFRVDDLSEMLEVYIDDKCVRNGNFWDFDFVNDVPDLLKTLGVPVTVEEYEYDDGWEDESEFEEGEDE
jgi:hypothetical protein